MRKGTDAFFPSPLPANYTARGNSWSHRENLTAEQRWRPPEEGDLRGPWGSSHPAPCLQSRPSLWAAARAARHPLGLGSVTSRPRQGSPQAPGSWALPREDTTQMEPEEAAPRLPAPCPGRALPASCPASGLPRMGHQGPLQLLRAHIGCPGPLKPVSPGP